MPERFRRCLPLRDVAANARINRFVRQGTLFMRTLFFGLIGLIAAGAAVAQTSDTGLPWLATGNTDDPVVEMPPASRPPAPTAAATEEAAAALLRQAGATAPAGAVTPNAPPAAPVALGAVLDQSPGLRLMAQAVRESGVESVLSATGTYTLFAPTDDAIGQLPAAPEVRTWLARRAVRGKLNDAAQARLFQLGGGRIQLQTLGGTVLTLRQTEQGVRVENPQGVGSLLRSAPLTAGSGTIYVVEAAL